MDKDTVKRFKTKVYDQALAEANRILDSRGERMKTYARILLVIGIVAFSLPLLLFWTRLESYIYFFISLLVTDIVFLVGSYIYPPIIAYFSRWAVAARMHDEMGGFDEPKLDISVSDYADSDSLPVGISDSSLITVFNKSLYSVKDCYILVKTIDPPIATHISSEMVLEWVHHFTNQKKTEIQGINVLSSHPGTARIALNPGNRGRKNTIFFTTQEGEANYKYIGDLRTYTMTLEIRGVYLWNEFIREKRVVISPVNDIGLHITELEN